MGPRIRKGHNMEYTVQKRRTQWLISRVLRNRKLLPPPPLSFFAFASEKRLFKTQKMRSKYRSKFIGIIRFYEPVGEMGFGRKIISGNSLSRSCSYRVARGQHVVVLIVAFDGFFSVKNYLYFIFLRECFSCIEFDYLEYYLLERTSIFKNCTIRLISFLCDSPFRFSNFDC